MPIFRSENNNSEAYRIEHDQLGSLFCFGGTIFPQPVNNPHFTNIHSDPVLSLRGKGPVLLYQPHLIFRKDKFIVSILSQNVVY